MDMYQRLKKVAGASQLPFPDEINVEEFAKLLGTSVKYFDYIGDERFGRIIAIETKNDPGPYKDLYWIYIEDEDPELNDKTDFINGVALTLVNGEPKGVYSNGNVCVRYADLRSSEDVYPDE